MLLKEGEVLFNKNGLKKVTVDDITSKVNIGKGTFYHFYENKEHLYLELYLQAQALVFNEVEGIIKNTSQYKPKKLCYEVMIKLLEGFSKSPILALTDGDTWSKATKKVSKDYNEIQNADDKVVFNKLLSAGIQFKYPDDIIIKLMQSCCLTCMMLIKSDKEMVTPKIMIKAIVDYIVDEGEKNGQNK